MRTPDSAALPSLEEWRSTVELLNELRSEYRITRALFEQPHHAVGVFDLEGRCLQANQQAAALFGFDSAAEMIGRMADEALVSGDQEEDREKRHQRLLVEGVIGPYEHRFLRRDGSEFYGETHDQLIRDEAGQPLYIQSVVRDVSARKALETELRLEAQALHERESRLNLIHNAMIDVVSQINVDGVIEYISPSVERLLGRKAENGLGKSISHLFPMIHPDSQTKLAELIQSIRDADAPVEGTVRLCALHADGHQVWLENTYRTVRNLDGRAAVVLVSRDVTAQKLAEDALRQREQELHMVTDHMEDVVFMIGPEGNIDYVSPSMQWVMGYDPAALIHQHGAAIAEPVHPDDQKIAEAAIFGVIQHAEKQKCEFRVRRADGQYISVEAVYTPVLRDGQPGGVLCVSRDITARKAMEEALRDREEKLRLITDNMADVVNVYDENGVARYVSPSVKSVIGIDAEMVTDQSLLDRAPLIHPDDILSVAETMQRVHATQQPQKVEYRLSRTDGGLIWLESVYSLLLKDGRTVGMASTTRDITARKAAELALRASEEQLRLITDNIADVIILVDMNGAIRHISPSARRVLGYPEEMLIGQDLDVWLKIIHADDLFQVGSVLQQLLNAAPSRSLEIRVHHADGQILNIESVYTPVYRDGQLEGVMSVWRDITARKAAEAALQASEERAVRFRDLLKTLFRVNLELSSVPTLDELMRRAVELGRERLEIDRMAVFLADQEQDGWVGTYGTDEFGNLCDERWVRFASNAFWKYDPATHTLFDGETDLLNSSGNVVGYGWNGVFAIEASGKILGTLCVDNLISGKVVPPEQTEILGLYASLLGHLISRKSAELALQTSEERAVRFRDRLKTLVKVNLELSTLESLDELMRRAVELGREQLGLDRASIFLAGGEPGHWKGTYGTDEKGNLRDERQVSISFNTHWNYDPQAHIQYHLETSLYDQHKQVVGHGWNLNLAIEDRGAIIGLLCADNLLTRQALLPEQIEILGLYAQTLGHLITRKRAEQELRSSREQAVSFRDRLKALYTVNLELSRVETLDELMRKAIELGRERLGLDRVSLWLAAGDPGCWDGTYGVDEHAQLRDERAWRFFFDPAWLHDSKTDMQYHQDSDLYNHLQEVVGRGWNLVLRIQDAGNTIGLLCSDNLFSKAPMLPDQLEILGLYSSALGHLITRKRAEAALKTNEEQALQFRDQLKVLHEVNLELSQAATLDELARQAIQLGRERLGLDRLSLWLEADEIGWWNGSYGVDEKGDVRDERAERFFFNQEWMLDPANRMLVCENDPLYDHEGQVVGQGWSVTVAIQGRGRTVGQLCADNLLKQQKLHPNLLELLTLYGGMLGHLINRKRAEEQRREQDERLRLILRSVRAGWWDWNIHTNQSIWADETYDIMAYDRDPANTDSDHWMARIHSDDRLMIQTAFNHMLATNGSLDYEARIVWPDGSIHWIHDVGQVMLDESGKPNRVLGILLDITARKQAEQALRENDERLKLALTAAKAGFWEWNLKTQTSVWSDQEYALFGLKPGDVEPSMESWKKVVHPDDHDHVMRAYFEAISQQKNSDVEYRVIWPDGSIRWLHDLGQVWLDAAGIPERMVGILLDITARKEAEMRLKQSEERLQLALSAAKAGWWEWNMKTQSVIWSDTVFILKGHAPGSFEPSVERWMGTIHEQDREFAFQQLHDGILNHTSVQMEYRVIWPDGSIHWMNNFSQVWYDSNDVPERMVGIVLDITERKQNQDVLRQSEERLRLITNNMMDSVAQVDGDGHIQYISPAFQKQTGLETVRWLKQPFQEWVREIAPSLSESPLNYPDLTKSNQSARLEHELIVSDGGRKWFETVGTAVRDADGRFEGAIFVMRNIDDRRNAEQREAELTAERKVVSMLRNMLSNVSHDFRTPISAINSSLYLLRRKLDPEFPGLRHVKVVEDQMQHMTNMVETMFTLAHLEDEDHDQIPVNTVLLVQTAVSRRREAVELKQIQMRVDLYAEPLWVLGESAMLDQALDNLLINALQYTHAGGSITVQTRREAYEVVIEITDTGIGISENDLPRIFESFYRADKARNVDQGSAGLGLTIAQRIIQRHGGRIDVESVLGQGSTFRVTLPLHQQSEPC